MAFRAVHWHEGMFLRPHHFQTAQRYASLQAHLSEKWDLHYDWGLRSVELDLSALANHRLVVRSLRARMRDGTLVAIPEDGVLPPIDLQGAFERQSAVTVYLALPILNLGKANAAANSSPEGARYLLDIQELEDENTGLGPQSIHVRLLNIKLLLSTQDHAGYEVLPIARVEKGTTADSTPQLDITYIPPLLACDAWSPLKAGILEHIYDHIGSKIELLAQQVVSRGITFDSLAQGDPQIFAQLRVANEAYALLGTLIFAEGVHPLPAYLELSRLVGQLSIFGDTRRPPELPKYDHDDLGTCFYKAKQYIFMLFKGFQEPEYKERPFIGAAMRMQVTLEQEWMQPLWQMFVGVKTDLGTEECVKVLTKSGREGLDMKIGSSDRADEIFRLGQRGLEFAYTPHPPRALPQVRGLVYFQVNRDSQKLEWDHVQRSLTVAVRMNEKLIDGNIQNERILRIRSGTKTNVMQFTLYVVPGKKT